MTNQLTKEEVDMLFSFVEDKNVRYKDVQFEIVDHLATAIEEEQATDPKLSFHNALQRVYGKFPITGFAMMILAKEEELSKYWRRRFFRAFLDCFTYPKVAFTLLVSTFIFFMLDYGNTDSVRFLDYIKLGSLIATSVFICTKSFVMNEGHENYLFTKTYVKILFFVFAIIFYARIDLLFYEAAPMHEVDLSGVQCLILTIFYSVAYYLIYAFGFAFPEILKQEIYNKYNYLGIKI
jgi:hypothetical protein